MEAIIGVGSMIAEGLIDIVGGTEIGISLGGALTTILDTLEEDGFEAIQVLMKSFSENDLYNIISSVEGSYPEIYISRSLRVGGLPVTEVLSNLNIVGSKLAKKGIDIASTQGKQLLINTVDQFQKIIKEHGVSAISNIAISAGAGYVGQKIAQSGYKNQNDNKVDYNNHYQNMEYGDANTLGSKN